MYETVEIFQMFNDYTLVDDGELVAEESDGGKLLDPDPLGHLRN